jgi:ATP-dependent Clp protease ATP-binding subunit ClpC
MDSSFMNSGNVSPTLLLAEDESRRARSFFVGTEHLFLAIAARDRMETGRILSGCGVRLEDAIERVRSLIKPWKPDENWSGLLIHTPRIKKITQRSTVLAERDGGKTAEPKHFLVALMEHRDSQAVRAILGRKPKRKRRPVDAEASDGGTRLEFESSAEQQAKEKSILLHFGRDLNQLAEEGKLNPLVGREKELEVMIRTLARHTKPNPLLIGEPGTGKTAMVEGLAQQIVAGNVPAQLTEARVIELSLASVVSGTQYRGEFEKRLELILLELSERPEVILFLDEFHLAVGAGAVGSGGMDAVNILKPALARGELRCIAATTLREYRKYVEPDAALSRRFQTIVLDQPDDAATLEILRGVRSKFEEHHGVKIADAALQAAVELSSRYDQDRNQPDKSIDLLDDACTRGSVQSTTSAGNGSEGEQKIEVGRSLVCKAVSDKFGIPLDQLSSSDLERLGNLEAKLSESIIGQTDAVRTVANSLREIRFGLRDEGRPNGVFLFAGPTGVGKTALAECLAREFYGLKESLIRIDLSEYTEPHSISRLIGAPPGYVGHDEQGQLTKALRTRPFSLVLLDEIEKAHPQVFDIFLQVFGSGRLTDGRGDKVDCQQAMFVMTSNLGAYASENKFGFQGSSVDEDKRQERIEEIHDACRQYFRPELLNRIDRIVCFDQLSTEVLRKILDGLVEPLITNLQAHDVHLEITPAAKDWLAKKAGVERGVPPLQRLLRDRVLNRVTQQMVENPARPLRYVADADADGITIQST